MNEAICGEEKRPDWLLPGGKINEGEFCRQYYMKHYLVYREGAFFGVEGRIADEDVLRKDIYRELRQYLCSGLASKTEKLLDALRLECPAAGLEERLEDMYVIPVSNGNYDLRRGFSTMKFVTRYRLPVAYDPEAEKPEKWLDFLSQLLEPEDIPTLQEYMGYCLVPTTRAQKMLIITGRGGEGKSRIGVVMKALLGDNMNQGSIAKVEASPFARADLEHLLLLVDDDMKMEALKQTNYIKSIITAEVKMDLERKGIQSYQGKLNVRFMAFGNDSLQALHDRSYGFFRRQIILTAKERPAQRQDDPYLAEQLVEEKEGILLWCIEGLERLILNDFRFTISDRAKNNLRESISRGNNIQDFLESEGYIQFAPEATVTSRLLYETYRSWCADNAVICLSSHSFWSYICQHLTALKLKTTRCIPIGNGKFARGFVGLRALSRY